MSAVITQKQFDQAKAESFAGNIIQTLNMGALTLMLSIGHRTGLFDTMRGMEPATSAEIAKAAGLEQRYVHEWLGAMVASRVVEVDPSTQKYTLPAEHAAFLTREAGADNLACISQMIPVLGGTEDRSVESFEYGGGVAYDEFDRFHEVMAEISAQSVIPALETKIIPLAEGLDEKLKRGIRAADLGCGKGKILNRLAELYPNSSFIGYDLSAETIDSAHEEAVEKGLKNVEFEVRDLADFDSTAETERFDLIATFDAVHDQPQPLRMLKGIYRALKPDGVYLMQEIRGSSHHHENIGHLFGPWLYTVSCLHCMTVSLAQGGEGLGAMWGEQKAREYLGKAGFDSVKKYEVEGDPVNDWFVVKK